MTNKITYTQQGDYLLPDLKLPEQPKVEIGIWGKRHLKYIKHHRPILYTNLLTSCKLTAYLADIDEQAVLINNQRLKAGQFQGRWFQGAGVHGKIVSGCWKGKKAKRKSWRGTQQKS